MQRATTPPAEADQPPDLGARGDQPIALGHHRFEWFSVDLRTEPGLAVPDSIRLVYLPPQTRAAAGRDPQAVLDEPIVNTNFHTVDELEAVVANRCLVLAQAPKLVSPAKVHWWPKPIRPI